LARNPTDIVELKLRARESLRRKLEAAAKRHQVSLNNEMVTRLEASLEDKARNDFATIAQDLRLQMADLDRLTTEMETEWARLKATREVLVLADLITTKIIDRGERDEGVKDLVWPARELRHLRATVDQPFREPRPGVRLQGESES
jgi:hypothetical protein